MRQRRFKFSKRELLMAGWAGRCVVLLVLWAVALALAGCVSKTQANARAREAFIEGQQQGMLRGQVSGNNVMVMGAVQNNQVPWTEGLTLAKALVTAGYMGPSDPKEILINRNGQQIRVDPKRLLSGEDVPLEAHDVVEIR